MKKNIILFLLSFVFATTSEATHLMGGEITWKCIKSGPHTGEYVFQVKVYRDCEGVAIETNMNLDVHNIPGLLTLPLTWIAVSDISPSCNTINGPNSPFSCNGTNIALAGNGVGAVEEHIYISDTVRIIGTPDANGWHFTWSGCCRNSDISNGLADQGFTLRAVMYSYTDSTGTIHPNNNNCYDSSPKFFEKPRTILEAGNGFDPLAFSNGFIYSHNAFDDERDSLWYEFAQPLSNGFYDFTNPSASGLQINGTFVNSSGMPYPPLSNLLPIPGVIINNYTGRTYYPADYIGNFVTCTRVEAWRCGQLVSEVFREIQVVLSAPVCNLGDTTGGKIGADTLCNIRPLVQPPFFFPVGSPQYQWDTIVHCGDTVSFDFIANDYDVYPNGSMQDLQFTVSGGQFMDYNVSPPALCNNPPCATFEEISTGLPPPFISNGGTGSGYFEWFTSCNHTISTCGDNLLPSLYTFVIKVQDDFCPAPAIENTAQVISIWVCPPCNLMKANATSIPATCANNNGSISVNPNAGFPPYHAFYFDMNGIPVNPDSLVAGDYEVRVRDSSQCETIDTVTVNQVNSAISINSSATIISDTLCYNSLNGSIDITPTSGISPYSFLWSNGDTSEDLTGIGPGVYSVMISDIQQCNSGPFSFSISSYNQAISSISSLSASCNGSTDGSIDLSMSFGLLPYNFLWSNGATSEDITSLTAGIYSVIITDSNSCIIYDTVNVLEPLPITSSLTVVNGALTGIASGGTVPYSHNIYDPSNLFFASSNNNFGTSFTVNPLVSGRYCMVTTDLNGCLDSICTFFATNFSPTVTVSISNNWCDSLTDLSISVSQDSGEVDMSTALFQSNAGSFDIASMSAGDTIGTAMMMAGGGSIGPLSSNLIVQSTFPTLNPTNAVISPVDTIIGNLGAFTISNLPAGGINILSNSIPDGNNYTTGNMSSVFFDNVFINPCIPLVFTTIINSELGDVQTTTFNFTVTSLNNTISDDILIYPNPTNDRFNIKFIRNISNLSISIYDMLGKSIYYQNQFYNIKSKEIIVDYFKAGTYLVIMNVDGIMYHHQIIIQD